MDSKHALRHRAKFSMDSDGCTVHVIESIFCGQIFTRPLLAKCCHMRLTEECVSMLYHTFGAEMRNHLTETRERPERRPWSKGRKHIWQPNTRKVTSALLLISLNSLSEKFNVIGRVALGRLQLIREFRSSAADTTTTWPVNNTIDSNPMFFILLLFQSNRINIFWLWSNVIQFPIITFGRWRRTRNILENEILFADWFNRPSFLVHFITGCARLTFFSVRCFVASHGASSEMTESNFRSNRWNLFPIECVPWQNDWVMFAFGLPSEIFLEFWRGRKQLLDGCLFLWITSL